MEGGWKRRGAPREPVPRPPPRVGSCSGTSMTFPPFIASCRRLEGQTLRFCSETTPSPGSPVLGPVLRERPLICVPERAGAV